MENATSVSIVMQAIDNVTETVNKVKGGLSSMSDTLEKHEATFKKMATAGTVAFSAIGYGIYDTIQAYAEAEADTLKYEHMLDSMVGSTSRVATGLTQVTTSLKLTGEKATEMREKIADAQLALERKQLALAKLNTEFKAGKMSQAEYSLSTREINADITKLQGTINAGNVALGQSSSKYTQLYKTVTMTAEQVDKARQQFEKVANANIKLGFDDEATNLSLAQLFKATGSATEAIKLNALAMDMARSKNIDLSTATNTVGKALTGTASVLKMYGVELDDKATKTDVINAMTKAFGGTAESVANSIQIKNQALQISYGNLKETIGGLFAGALGDVTAKVQTYVDLAQKWVDENPELTKQIGYVALAVSGLVAVAGTLGLILPTIISGFSMLLSSVGLIALAIGGLIYIGWTYRDQILEFIKLLNEKTGLVTALQTAFNSLTKLFNEYVIPAVTWLWETLKPYLPYLGDLAVLLAGALLNGFVLVVKAVGGLIDGFIWLLDVGKSVYGYFSNSILPVIKEYIGYIQSAVTWVENLISAMARLAGAGVSKIANVFSNVPAGVTKVNDAVISPSGSVVSTSPQDWLIATKNPMALAGAGIGGGNITVNINGGNYLDRNAGVLLGDQIIQALQRNINTR